MSQINPASATRASESSIRRTTTPAIRHGARARTGAALRRFSTLHNHRTNERLPRMADQGLALLMILLLLPALLLRGLVAKATRGTICESQWVAGRGGRPIQRLFFAGFLPGRGLASLLNVLRGELAFVGPTQQSLDKLSPADRAEVLLARPGMISPADARQRLAIDHDGEHALLRSFACAESVRGNAGLLVRSLVSRAAYGEQKFPTPRQLQILGVPVQNVTMEEAVQWILDRSTGVRPTLVPFVNPHCLNIAHGDAEYRRILQQADYVLPDGSGIRVACRLKQQRLAGNVNGTDLFPRLCARLAQTKQGIFLLGAGPEVAETVARNMQARFPGLNIAGTHDGYFMPAEESAVIRQINTSGASILLVAMGVPLQEKWLARNASRLHIPVCMGVGGLFDFYSDRIPRAPMWLREVGLEWTWRLLQEPGRMWRRYVIGNPLFVLRVLRERRAERRQQRAALADRSPWRQRLDTARAGLRQRSWQRSVRGDQQMRRVLDMVGAGCLLLALSPLLLLVMAAIRLESEGSVFFSQPRVGRHGTTFRFWKFRSMYVDAEARLAELAAKNEMAGGVLFKMREDPRVTRIGRFIRRFSIDELPQLWNVLRGDMSLVGPRPALPREVAQYDLEDRARLEAIPGITCIWQVSGRSEIPFEQQVQMDREYIHRSSLRTNVELLFKTIPAVVSGRGAY